MSSELIISIKLYHSMQHWIYFIIILYQCIPTGCISRKEQKFGLISVNGKKKPQNQEAIFQLFYLTQFWILLFTSWLQEIKLQH